jgi:hypothetical protein
MFPPKRALGLDEGASLDKSVFGSSLPMEGCLDRGLCFVFYVKAGWRAMRFPFFDIGLFKNAAERGGDYQ